MNSNYERKNNSLSYRLSVLLALLLVAVIVSTSNAYSNPSQGFAMKSVSSVRGTQADMYTGNPSSPFWFIANLTAICVGQGTSCPPGSYFFETGWIRGVQTGDSLKHYIS